MKIRKKISILFLCFLFPLGALFCMEDFGGDISFDGLDGEDAELLGELFKAVGVDEMEQQNKNLDEAHRSNPNPIALDEFKLWRKTEGFRSRDPLFLIPQRRLTVDKAGLTCHLFYNMTNSLPVRPGLVLSTKAADMLVELTKSGGVLGSVDLDDMSNLLRVLPFLSKMTVQGRKLGGMFQANIVDKRWVLQVDTLLMLAERNFWITGKKDRQALLDALGDSGKKESYRMRFGLGDTRLRLGYRVSKFDAVQAILGASFIVPTSRIFRKKPCAIIKTKVGDPRKQLIDDLLNMTRQLMIEPKLGTGHWGLGFFLDSRIHIIPEKLDFWSRFSFDYLFDGNEYRYMPSTKPISLKVLGDLTAQDTIPEGFPVNSLFPCLARGCVSPGNIFNATVGFDWSITKCWKATLGYDFYAQQAERIKNITAPNVDTALLVVDNAIASRIIQHKVFSTIMYEKKGTTYDWRAGVGGDLTFSSQGGPRDWTVGANIGITF